MNWSKAKNVLIMAFLITNILLVYGILSDKLGKEESKLSDQVFYANVVKMLEEKQIKMLVPLPENVAPMGKVTVEYDLFRDDEIANRFLKEYTKQEIEDKIFYVDGLEELAILNSKELLYTNNNNSMIYKDLAADKLFEIADEFLKKRGLYDEQVKKIFVKKTGGSYKLLYTKVIDGFAYEEAYMKFDIDSRGVYKFQRLWINKIDYQPAEIKMTDPSEALLRLLYYPNIEQTDIIDLSPCYYFGGSKNNVIDYKNAKKGEAVPVWRIILSNGEKYFFEMT